MLGGYKGFNRRSVESSQMCIVTTSAFIGYQHKPDKEWAAQLCLAKKAVKKCLLDSVNKAVLNDMGKSSEDEASSVYSLNSAQRYLDFVKDPSKL